MKILLIEDDQFTSSLLAATLSAHHYVVDQISDGAAGLELAVQWHYDLILLDVLLPSLSGIEVCRQLRNRGCQTPILVLTTQDSNQAVVAGLDAGADDYVAKSCDQSQLLARVRALLRRSGGPSLPPLLTWGGLCLNPASAQVRYNHQPVALRPKEYSLLELFLRYPHRIHSRSTIIDHLWTIDETPVEGSVTNLIKDLRQRLRLAGMSTDLIETVYGLGYRLKPAPEAAPQPSPREDQASPSSREPAALVAIQQISDRFRLSLSQRITSLETAVQALQPASQSQRDAIRTEVHKLAGGLGTFGYEQAAKTAQAIEDLLEAGPEATLASQIFQLLQRLRQDLGLGSGAVSRPQPVAAGFETGFEIGFEIGSEKVSGSGRRQGRRAG